MMRDRIEDATVWVNPPMKLGRDTRTENFARGALLVSASSGLFALMGAAIKLISPHLSLEMIVFFRNFFGLIALSPWLIRAGRAGLATRRLHIHGIRTLSGLAAMYCFFYALGHLRLSEAVLLNFSAPLFIPLIALLWLREATPPRLRWALGVGLIGVTLILKPTTGVLSPVALIGLASGLFAAFATVSVRNLSLTEPPERIVFYFGAMGTLVSGIPLLWNWHTPDLTHWGLLFGIGALATAAQVLLTRGISHVPAAHVGPFSYSTVVFATLIGWLAWGEVLDAFSLFGGLMVCAGGVLVVCGERTARTMDGA